MNFLLDIMKQPHPLARVWLRLVMSGKGLCPPAQSLPSFQLQLLPLVVERVVEGGNLIRAFLLTTLLLVEHGSEGVVNVVHRSRSAPVLAPVVVAAEVSATALNVITERQMCVAQCNLVVEFCVREGCEWV